MSFRRSLLYESLAVIITLVLVFLSNIVYLPNLQHIASQGLFPTNTVSLSNWKSRWAALTVKNGRLSIIHKTLVTSAVEFSQQNPTMQSIQPLRCCLIQKIMKPKIKKYHCILQSTMIFIIICNFITNLHWITFTNDLKERLVKITIYKLGISHVTRLMRRKYRRNIIQIDLAQSSKPLHRI